MQFKYKIKTYQVSGRFIGIKATFRLEHCAVFESIAELTQVFDNICIGTLDRLQSVLHRNGIAFENKIFDLALVAVGMGNRVKFLVGVCVITAAHII